MSRPALPLLLCLALSFPAAAQTQKKIAQNEQELDRVRVRIQAVQSKIDKGRGQKDALRDAIEASEKKIAAVRSQLSGFDARIEAQQTQVETTQQQRAAAQQQLDVQRAALARQLRTAYMIGERGQVKMLFNQDDANQLGRVATYYDYLNRSRLQRMEIIAAQMDKLHLVAERLRTQIDELASLKAEQQATLASLEDDRKAREVAIGKLQEQLDDEFEELKRLRGDEKRVQDLLQSLRDVLADVPMKVPNDGRPFAQQRGKLPWPLRGEVLAQYGAPKAGGKMSWNGLWLAAAEGTPVRAIARGRVAYVGWLHRYGLIVVLEHDGGYFSLYGHNQRVTRKEGEAIDPGEVIAAAGNTGGADRSGVYLEIRKGSDALNPGDWLAK